MSVFPDRWRQIVIVNRNDDKHEPKSTNQMTKKTSCIFNTRLDAKRSGTETTTTDKKKIQREK